MIETEVAAPAPDEAEAWLARVREQAAARRTRQRSPRERLVLRIALAIACLAHLVAALWLAQLMRERAPADDDDRIEVRLLDAPPPMPPPVATPPPPDTLSPPLPTLAPRAATPPRMTAVPASPSAPVSSVVAPAPHVYESDGAIRLPPAPPVVRTLRSSHDEALARGRELMQRGHNLLHCRSHDRQSGTPAEMAAAAGRGRKMYQNLFHNPANDALTDRTIAQAGIDAASDDAADKEATARAVCDEIAPPQQDAAGADQVGKGQ